MNQKLIKSHSNLQILAFELDFIIYVLGLTISYCDITIYHVTISSTIDFLSTSKNISSKISFYLKYSLSFCLHLFFSLIYELIMEQLSSLLCNEL